MDTFPLQQAIYTKLKNNTGVAALVSDRIYDEPPADVKAMPYIHIGEFIGGRFDTKTSIGWDYEVALHVWSAHRGRAQAEAILGAIEDALHRQAMTVTGFSFVDMTVIQKTSFEDSDGLTRHGVARVRVVIEGGA